VSVTSKRVVAAYFEMWNSGDVSEADEIVSAGWVDHSHPEVTGPNGLREAITRIRAAQPDLRFQIQATLTDSTSSPSSARWARRT
jgi:predicted ester cyclase